jgi:MFS family permease
VPQLAVWQATALLVLFVFLGSNYVMIQPHGKAFFPEHLVGRVVTVVNLSTFTGIATLQAVTGLILGAFPENEMGAHPDEAYRAMFAFFAVVSAVALAIYARSTDVPPSTERGER